MTQATTTTVFKIQQMYGILHLPQQHVIHQASNKVDVTDTMVLCKMIS